MKKFLMVFALVMTAALHGVAADAKSTAEKSALVDMRADIGKLIENPSEMTAAIKKLSAEDQVKFVSEVNAAISKMPGSEEEKSAKFLTVNHAALKGAEKGNVSAMIAEVYASVPPEHLTIIAERFGQDLFNRAADPRVTYTDSQFADIAVETMEKINARLAEVEHREVRGTIAALMFIEASNGTSEELINRLVATLPENARDIAKSEWIASALGSDGRTKSFEPMLAAADAGRRPDPPMILIISGPQFHDTLLSDLVGKNIDNLAGINARTPILDAVQNPLRAQVPTMGSDVGSSGGGSSTVHQPGTDTDKGTGQSPIPEPGPYSWQSTNN